LPFADARQAKTTGPAAAHPHASRAAIAQGHKARAYFGHLLDSRGSQIIALSNYKIAQLTKIAQDWRRRR
tara:strand:- start:154 stop:363 length:210 start_codon:yes stop_codon:yes gene_type:complete